MSRSRLSSEETVEKKRKRLREELVEITHKAGKINSEIKVLEKKSAKLNYRLNQIIGELNHL